MVHFWGNMFKMVAAGGDFSAAEAVVQQGDQEPHEKQEEAMTLAVPSLYHVSGL